MTHQNFCRVTSKTTAVVLLLCIGHVAADIPCVEGEPAPAGFAVTPVMPTRHFAEGHAQISQEIHGVKVADQSTTMELIYDYPGNRLMERWWADAEHQYPYPDTTALFDGVTGNYNMYLENFDKCIYIPFGMGIERPDSFVPSVTDGKYAGRECRQGFWADHYVVPIGETYGDFDAWFHVDTTYPLEFLGQTIPTILADFVHTNMVPIFEYLEPKSEAAEPAFFPAFIGSWSALDAMFSSFDDLTKGDCQNVFDLLPSTTLEQEFLKAQETAKNAPEWAQQHIRRSHAMQMTTNLIQFWQKENTVQDEFLI